MSQFQVLVVDDEPLARGMVVDLLSRDAEVKVVGECADGTQALDAVRRQKPDIIFLDIEMPELSGLDLIEGFEEDEAPVVVLVTAYDDYATRAFDAEALDYVLKPFSDERFFLALERAKRRVRGERLTDLAERVAELSAELGTEDVVLQQAAEKYLRRLPVRIGDRTIIVKPEDIVWIESQDYYVRVHTRVGKHLLRASLNSLEEQLDPSRFLRIHRSALVNLDEVREIQRLLKGARTVVLMDGTKLPVSRSRRRRLDEALPAR